MNKKDIRSEFSAGPVRNVTTSMPPESKQRSDLIHNYDNLKREILGAIRAGKHSGERPEHYGAERFFVNSFITREMSPVFWDISSDFLNYYHNYLSDQNILEDLVEHNGTKGNPWMMLQIRIINIIYNAAKKKDPYSVDLIKSLYKIYYKREYNQLKRFKTVSAEEIFSLSSNEELRKTDCIKIARLLVMSELFQIQTDKNCDVMHYILNESWNDLEKRAEKEDWKFEATLYKKCEKQINAWIQERGNKWFEDLEKQFEKDGNFSKNCMIHMGMPPKWINKLNRDYEETKKNLITILYILRSNCPDVKFTYDDVTNHLSHYETADTLVTTYRDFFQDTESVMGLKFSEEENEDLLQNEIGKTQSLCKVKEYMEKSKSDPEKEHLNSAQEEAREIKSEDSAIAAAEERLRRKEEELQDLQKKYAAIRSELSEAKKMLEAADSDKAELFALRDYVYKISEDDIDKDQDTSILEMKQSIQNRNVVIIGGHKNWTNKMKAEFPNWTFLDANISMVNDSMIVSGAEKVYFFTNHLSHGIYVKYIALVRKKEIPFSYLHSVNIENLIKIIYSDLN